MGACMAGSSRSRKLDEYSIANLPRRQTYFPVEFCGPCDSKLELVHYPGHNPVTVLDKGTLTEVIVIFRFLIPREFKCIVDAIQPSWPPDVGKMVIDRYVSTCRLIAEATSPGKMTLLGRIEDPVIKDYAIEFVQYLRQKYDEFSSGISFLKIYLPNSVNFIGGDSEIQAYSLMKDFKSEGKLLLFFSGIRHYLEEIFCDGDESNVELLENYMEEKSEETLPAFREISSKIGLSEAKVYSRGKAIIKALCELLNSLKNNPCPQVTMLLSLKHSVIHFVQDVRGRFLSLHSNMPANSIPPDVLEAQTIALISQTMYQCAFLRSPPPSLRFVDIHKKTIPFQEDDTS